MPAWTNLHPVTVGDIKVGSKTVLYEDAYFEVVEHKDGITKLRCYEPCPEKGYGKGVIVEITSDTKVIYDSNLQGK